MGCKRTTDDVKHPDSDHAFAEAKKGRPGDNILEKVVQLNEWPIVGNK